MMVKYTCSDIVSTTLTLFWKTPILQAYIDENIKAYQRYHCRFLHANDALPVLHLCDAAGMFVNVNGWPIITRNGPV